MNFDEPSADERWTQFLDILQTMEARSFNFLSKSLTMCNKNAGSKSPRKTGSDECSNPPALTVRSFGSVGQTSSVERVKPISTVLYD